MGVSFDEAVASATKKNKCPMVPVGVCSLSKTEAFRSLSNGNQQFLSSDIFGRIFGQIQLIETGVCRGKQMGTKRLVNVESFRTFGSLKTCKGRAENNNEGSIS